MVDFHAILLRQHRLGGVKIFNKRIHDTHHDAIYCGRPYGKFVVECFGNPFIIGQDGFHNECCDKFEAWLSTGESFGNINATEERRRWILTHIPDLKGKDLECWCWPKRCHCESLASRANGVV